MKSSILSLLTLLILLSFSSCRRGCRVDAECVTNYDSDAKKDGNCTGCRDSQAINFCPEADEDDGSCLFQRRFYTNDTLNGWYDIWVSDSADNPNPVLLRYEGRTSFVYIDSIPDCNLADGLVTVLRPDGEYYYEIESQTGVLSSGWVIYRREGCRLFVIP